MTSKASSITPPSKAQSKSFLATVATLLVTISVGLGYWLGTFDDEPTGNDKLQAELTASAANSLEQVNLLEEANEQIEKMETELAKFKAKIGGLEKERLQLQSHQKDLQLQQNEEAKKLAVARYIAFRKSKARAAGIVTMTDEEARKFGEILKKRKDGKEIHPQEYLWANRALGRQGSALQPNWFFHVDWSADLRLKKLAEQLAEFNSPGFIDHAQDLQDTEDDKERLLLLYDYEMKKYGFRSPDDLAADQGSSY